MSAGPAYRVRLYLRIGNHGRNFEVGADVGFGGTIEVEISRRRPHRFDGAQMSYRKDLAGEQHHAQRWIAMLRELAVSRQQHQHRWHRIPDGYFPLRDEAGEARWILADGLIDQNHARAV